MGEPDWLRLQKKIFTRYVNQKFRSEGSQTKVNDILEDVGDGLVLIELLEIMSGKKYPEKKPKSSKVRIQQIDSCNKMLQFAKKDCSVPSQCSAEDIVDKKEKLIMGMIFQIIIKYMKLDDDDAGASTDLKEALLLWLKNKTAGYPTSKVNIENFNKSFHNGLAFCALIHKMRPKLIPFDDLNPDDKVKNLTLALDTAAKYCNVEKYLEPTDIPKLDELSMVVYLSDWYYGIALLQKQDAGARRIGKLVVMTQTHDRMKAEYNDKAKKLVGWIDNKINQLNQHTWDNTLEGIKKKLEEFYSYKSKEKGEKITEHMDIEALFNDLALRLQNNKRPPFNPNAGLAPNDLQNKFNALEEAENKRAVAMQIELARQIRLDKMAKRFANDVEKFFGWHGDKVKYLNKKEECDSIAQATLNLNVLSSYNREYENVKVTRLAALKQLAAEIVNDNYIHKADISAKENDVENKFKALQPLEVAKKKVLDDDLARENHKEKLRLEFASAATDFERFANDHIEATKSVYFGDSLESVSAYGDTLSKLESQIKSDADSKKKTYDAIWKEMQEYKIKENNYTNLNADALGKLRTNLDSAVQTRRAAYQAELEKQKANDALCHQFADKIKAFFDWLAKHRESTSDKNAPLDKQLAAVEAGLTNKEADSKITELEGLAKKIQDAEITNNKYTNQTANDAKTSHHQYLILLGKRKTLLVTELENSKRQGLTPEQMKEIQDNFQYFDKDKSGFLDRRELRTCMQSLGYDASPADVTTALNQYDKDKDGKISRAEFVEFMTKKLGDTNTKEEIIESFILINQKDFMLVELMNAVVNETTFKQEYVDYLKKEMKPQAEGLNYQKWTEEVFAR